MSVGKSMANVDTMSTARAKSICWDKEHFLCVLGSIPWDPHCVGKALITRFYIVSLIHVIIKSSIVIKVIKKLCLLHVLICNSWKNLTGEFDIGRVSLYIIIILYVQRCKHTSSSSIEKVSPSKARENLVEITDKMRFGKKEACFSPQGRQGHCRNYAIEDKIDIEWLNKPLKWNYLFIA